jgi:hypothetical protein
MTTVTVMVVEKVTMDHGSPRMAGISSSIVPILGHLMGLDGQF